MKKITQFALILGLALLVLALSGNLVSAQANTCQPDMISASCTIAAGETFNGDLSLVDSHLTIEKGGRVNGTISSLRSDIQVDGWVTGDVTTVLGSLRISDSAHINGDLEAIGGDVEVSVDAIINGERSIVSIAGLADPDNWPVESGRETRSGSFVGRSIWLIFVSLALAALGLVAVLIFQKPAEKMVKTIRTRPLVAFAIGLLFVISLPFAIVLMSVTIILIPVVLAVALLLPIVLIFAWVAVGMLLSQLLTARLGWDWAPAVHAAAGTLAITFIAGLLLFVECLGWTFITLLTLTGLGAFVLLFFKASQPPARAKVAVTLPPAPPASPEPGPMPVPETQPETLQPQAPTPESTSGENNALDELFPKTLGQGEGPQTS